MGYTIYWEPKRTFSQAELSRLNAIWRETYNREIRKIHERGLSTAHYEWAGDNPMSNSDFEFMKTARTPYDYAVKKALLAVQRASNNGYEIKCDDGFLYTASGLKFREEMYMESYRPKQKITETFTLEQLPISYESRGEGVQTNGEYAWNQGKKPRFIGKRTSQEPKQPRLFRGSRGGIYYINAKGHKEYCDKHCCKRR